MDRYRSIYWSIITTATITTTTLWSKAKQETSVHCLETSFKVKVNGGGISSTGARSRVGLSLQQEEMRRKNDQWLTHWDNRNTRVSESNPKIGLSIHPSVPPLSEYINTFYLLPLCPGLWSWYLMPQSPLPSMEQQRQRHSIYPIGPWFMANKAWN